MYGILSRPHRHVAHAILVGTLLLLSGCVVQNVATNDGFTALENQSRILLMPPDIKYYRVTASGITEPNADWTQSARTQFDSAFQKFEEINALEVIEASPEELSDIAVEYDKLHSAVGNTILINHFGMTKLPAKDGAFDWSLGQGVSDLLAMNNERYALFVHYRDYQASGGRVGVAIFASLLGATVYTGHQAGFASLVDLNTGEVVWFNHVPLARGDMRSEKGAGQLVDQLFASLVDANE